MGGQDETNAKVRGRWHHRKKRERILEIHTWRGLWNGIGQNRFRQKTRLKSA